MKPLEAKTPEQFLADFFTSFTEEVVYGEADPQESMGRYYTKDVVQTVDGVQLDWARLLSHIRPIRKNLADYRYDVHEALLSGERIASRLTIHARMHKGQALSTEVYMFAEFTPQGLLHRADQLTRTLRSGSAARQEEEA